MLLAEGYEVPASALSSEPLDDVSETQSTLSFVEFFSRESTFLFQEENEIVKS